MPADFLRGGVRSEYLTQVRCACVFREMAHIQRWPWFTHTRAGVRKNSQTMAFVTRSERAFIRPKQESVAGGRSDESDVSSYSARPMVTAPFMSLARRRFFIETTSSCISLHSPGNGPAELSLTPAFSIPTGEEFEDECGAPLNIPRKSVPFGSSLPRQSSHGSRSITPGPGAYGSVLSSRGDSGHEKFSVYRARICPQLKRARTSPSIPLVSSPSTPSTVEPVEMISRDGVTIPKSRRWMDARDIVPHASFCAIPASERRRLTRSISHPARPQSWATSQSRRGTQPVTHTPGPGSYSLESPPQKSGDRHFGSTVPRNSVSGEPSTPGPGDYTPTRSKAESGTVRWVTSAKAGPQPDPAPGPGAYDPPVSPRRPGTVLGPVGRLQFGSQADRFPAWEEEDVLSPRRPPATERSERPISTGRLRVSHLHRSAPLAPNDSHPEPGTYNPDRTMQYLASKNWSQPRGGFLPSTRREAPRVLSTPGPGQYELSRPRAVSAPARGRIRKPPRRGPEPVRCLTETEPVQRVYNKPEINSLIKKSFNVLFN
jgi:hypothetical protein